MKKRTEHNLKSERRTIKKRPRMRVHGQTLKKPSRFGGMAIAKLKKR